jgi:Lon protease-like protein
MKIMTAGCVVSLVALLWMPPVAQAQGTAANTGPAAGGLPAMIPIFPLESPTLFPNASFPLHIFEPRYRAMIADALKGDRIIGMVMLQPGHEAEYEGRPPIFPIGCAGLITDYEQLPDGRYNIVLGGLVKFRVTAEDNSRPYRLARVETIPEVLDDRATAALTRERERLGALLSALYDQFGVSAPPPGIPDEQVVDELSEHLPMTALARQRLLEQESPLARAGALVELLEAMVKAQR